VAAAGAEHILPLERVAEAAGAAHILPLAEVAAAVEAANSHRAAVEVANPTSTSS